jgi:hypothetical protein
MKVILIRIVDRLIMSVFLTLLADAERLRTTA